MKVVGADKIENYALKHANSKSALESWLAEAKQAKWTQPQDIKNRYRSADFLSGNRVIFNIKGNHHRLVVKVRYQHGIVMIDWIGTHAEYDKKKF
jgi:mRNA interferase HigB